MDPSAAVAVVLARTASTSTSRTPRELCNRLIDGFIESGSADAAGDYARQIPVRVISLIIGVPEDMADTFTGWVQDVLEFAHDEARVARGRDALTAYLLGLLAERRGQPGRRLDERPPARRGRR